jgi:mono/diheme cytochrome c family protein
MERLPMVEEKDKFTDHDYDGIRELDNDLPRWWLYLFYFTIIWGLLYLVHYHVLDSGDSSYAELQKEYDPNWKEEVKSGLFTGYRSPFYSDKELTPRQRIEFATLSKFQGDSVFNDLIKRAMKRAKAENLDKLISAFPDLWQQLAAGDTPPVELPVEAVAKTGSDPVIDYQPLTDVASLTAGKDIFSISCASCHGPAGEGGIGPNMTDEYWLHGGSINDIISTIEKGVPAKGMIPWRGQLKPEQILQVASYISTLQGTNPPNAKAPQGEVYNPM